MSLNGWGMEFSVGNESCSGGTQCGQIEGQATISPTALITEDDTMDGGDPCNDDERCTE